MTSLSEVYQGRARTAVGLRRFYTGVVLFALGAGMVVGGIVVATTDIASTAIGLYPARELAGVLAGVGILAVFVGLFVALPASYRTRAAAAIGASVALFAVILFVYAYPAHWIGAPGAGAGLTLLTITVYFLGTMTTSWCLFVAVATFKTRKDPGGTARMRVTKEGRIRLVEDDNRSSGMGGVGLFGFGPTATVQNRSQSTSSKSSSGSNPPPRSTSRTASDGGATTRDSGIREPGSTAGTRFTDAADISGQPDRYCGNCANFHYIETDSGIKPYCDRYKKYLDDMEACDRWTPNK